MSLTNMLFGAGVINAKNAPDNLHGGVLRSSETHEDEGRDLYKRAALAMSYAPNPAPSRPADSPVRSFVGKTLTQLQETQARYQTERDLLAKDIQKLQEEHSQLVSSIGALQAAIDALDPPDVSQVDEASLFASVVTAVDSELKEDKSNGYRPV